MTEGSPRVQPYYCPYCGEADFVPSGAAGEADGFHCSSCDRRFAVRFLGLGAPEAPPVGGEGT
ncbi:MAG: Insertion element protein [Actinomycetota bacterium]